MQIKLYVLIRPRAGDFLYDDHEMDIMEADIDLCIQAGCDGVVVGILNADGSVDKERCSRLIGRATAAGLGVTFHRAFDLTADLYQALDDVIELGCERLLTSGGKTTAMEGASNIAHLVERAAGRISIMPGSGVNELNVNNLVRFTNATEVHSSARKHHDSKMVHHNDHILMGGYSGVPENWIDETDTERVKKILELANTPIPHSEYSA